jgi:BA14K-like protein
MRRLIIFAALSCAVFTTQSWADSKSHCELFAKDVADGRTKDVDQWQKLYRSSYADCIEQYAAAEPAAEPEKKSEAVKVAKKPAGRKSIKSPGSEATPETVIVAAKAPSKNGKNIEPGTAAWNEYCAAKYVSFNKATGTYRSHTGKERRCLVTGKS